MQLRWGARPPRRRFERICKWFLENDPEYKRIIKRVWLWVLDRLREVHPPARGIVTNARCLSEGIDVRALDGVAFIDPKESQVDIIQAVGRAIRKAKRKRHGIIILPVYISSDEDEEKTLEDSSFRQVWRVLRALRSHDDQLACELDNLRTNLGRRGNARANLPAKMSISLPTRLFQI